MSDGVIHTAFIHDFSQYPANAEIERRAMEAIGAALAGSGRPFFVTSGTAGLTPGHLGTEGDPLARSQLRRRPPRSLGKCGACAGVAWRARIGGAPAAVGPWRR
jgi:hypothetical protein